MGKGTGIVVDGYDVTIAGAMLVGIGGVKVAVEIILVAEIDAVDIVCTGVVGNGRSIRTVRHQEGRLLSRRG